MVNKVIFIGRLGKNAEVKTAQNNKEYVVFSLATSESWKDKQSGEQKERTEWHSIVLYDRLGEVASQYLKKGSQVYIEGRLQTRKWQDKEGKDRYTTEIVANDMQMIGGRAGGGGGAGGGSFAGGASEPRERGGAPEPAPVGGGGPGDFDDDVPF